MGKDVEFLFVDSPNHWEPRSNPWAKDGDPVDAAWQLYGGERSEIEKRLAGSKPFTEWLRFEESPNKPTPASVEASYEYLMQYMESQTPIDVVIALSQGTAIMAGLMAKLKREGLDAPWNMSMFFCSVPPEAHFLAPPPVSKSDQPVVAVLGGQGDPWYAMGKSALPARYSNLTIFEH